MADSAADKTEQATPKRRNDERKKGHIVMSQDISAAVSMLVSFAVLKVMGQSMGETLSTGVRGLLLHVKDNIAGYSDLRAHLLMALPTVLGVILPIMVVGMAVSIASTLAQSRLLVSSEQLKPQFSRLNPIEGIKRLFSARSLFELLKSILKVVLVGVVVYFSIRPQLHNILLLYDSPLSSSFSWICGVLVDAGLKVSVVLLILGAMDYFYQWRQYEKDLRMTKEEVKEEYKQTEGNPEVKGKIKSMQRKLARQRMMQAVPQADVVLRNPTHYAVALKYDHGKQRAPVCLAKGMNEVALRIVEIAEESHVHIEENPPLTRALYKAVDIGQEIPAEFYQAVAEILAYIYRLRRAGRR